MRGRRRSWAYQRQEWPEGHRPDSMTHSGHDGIVYTFPDGSRYGYYDYFDDITREQRLYFWAQREHDADPASPKGHHTFATLDEARRFASGEKL